MKLPRFFNTNKSKKNKSRALYTRRSQASSHRPHKKVPYKTAVGQLKVGMYVSELDRPWEETPFLIQGFYVRSQDDIDEISDHCNFVFVDPVYGLKGSSSPNGLIHKLPDQQEWGNAQATYSRIQSLTKGILDEIRLGGRIAPGKVTEFVDKCLESILSNPGALALISQMSLKYEGLERHSISTCVLSIAFGHYLGYPVESLEKLGIAALLHDVGMVKLPDDILKKVFSSSPLTSQEIEIVKMHTTYGRDILMANSSLWHAVDIAYSHHERYDGSGYPRGLKAKSIPKFAQIIALADTYDSLTTPWGGAPVSSLDALKVIYKEKAKQFDPVLAQKFTQFIHIYPPGAIVQIRSGDIGVIVKRNKTNKHLPTILLLRNESGEPRTPELLDLQAFYEDSDEQASPICKMYPSGSFGIDVGDLFKKGFIER